MEEGEGSSSLAGGSELRLLMIPWEGNASVKLIVEIILVS